jgi:hypothetical protein
MRSGWRWWGSWPARARFDLASCPQRAAYLRSVARRHRRPKSRARAPHRHRHVQVTSRRPPVTPIPAPRCATTEAANPSTVTPPTSSLPSSRRQPLTRHQLQRPNNASPAHPGSPILGGVRDLGERHVPASLAHPGPPISWVSVLAGCFMLQRGGMRSRASIPHVRASTDVIGLP